MKNYLEQSTDFRLFRQIATILIIFSIFMLSNGLSIAADTNQTINEKRNFDARIAFNQGFSQVMAGAQQRIVSKMASEVKDLAYSFDENTGVIRSLSSHTGFLTPAKIGQQPMTVAMAFLKANAVMMGVSKKDLAKVKLLDKVYSKVSGATHIYLQQEHKGLPVYSAQLQMNISQTQRILSISNSLMTGMDKAANTSRPSLDLADAVKKAAQQLGLSGIKKPKILNSAAGIKRLSSVEHSGISLQPIKGSLMWLPIRHGMMRLVWNFQIHTLDKQHVYDFTVDAVSGKVWTRFDWVSSAQYRVYARPVESPNHSNPLPPADARPLINNPANSNASPFGWHDTNGSTGAEFTVTRGNNVHAYIDADGDNAPDSGSSPSGGASLSFDFPVNLNSSPDTYRRAAVTNLFYWNNIIHDIQYQYGFDEAAGNFQINSYGKGGQGNDAVLAEAQDGSGTNNANFLTPPDGTAPRMQMFLWDRTSPERDGDFDNGIIIHEYGHGISTRLVGGPSNVNCLTNNQQPGEGLSDWWALAYTAKVGDKGTDPRGIGTYAFGQPTSGTGIRSQRYSTDPAVNDWTYASINGMRVPHGVGSVWAQAAWEVYWALVDKWGFDPNLYNAMGNAGNQRMMLYVNEGLKNTACNPTFAQVRDGIIDAAKVLHNGEDVCRIWSAFADFGLGVDAVSGGPDSTSPSNGFKRPAACEVDNIPPVSSLTAPVSGAIVAGTTTVTASANDAIGVTRVEFNVDNVLINTDSTAPYRFSWDTTTLSDGSHSLSCKAYDAAGNVGSCNPVAVTVNNKGGGIAVFDPALNAPKCAMPGSTCDSETLLLGRDDRGPEPHQPNTINNTCADGTAGNFHDDESSDRMVISTTDTRNFAAGKTVRVDVTVWAWATPADDHLDLYYAADANNPNWIFIKTLTPTVVGKQTLSATYTLPAGSLQAVRAHFRYRQSRTTCGNGAFSDHDDLIFAVKAGDGDTGAVIFSDNFETDKGWIVNPSGRDNASTGQWERGNPQSTTSNGVKQLGITVSGVNDLVTGRLAGNQPGVHDIDDGVTSVLSPAVTLPSNGDLKLTFQYYLAHRDNASNADFLRVKIVGASTETVFQERGAANNDNASWAEATVSLNAFAGQVVRILIEAADAGRPSLVEAGIDDVMVTKE